MNNDVDFWFTMIFFGIPLFITIIGIMSGEKDAFLGAIALACIFEIVVDVLFTVTIIGRTSGVLTPEEIHYKPIVFCLFLVSTLFLLIPSIQKESPQTRS